MILYCKTLYFRCILISRFWNIEISLHFNLAFSECSVSIYQAFDGQIEFLRVWYLISRFYPTREIRENLMHVKSMFYSIRLQSSDTYFRKYCKLGLHTIEVIYSYVIRNVFTTAGKRGF